MNTELLLLASFNDIFALFVGLNIAYLLVNQVKKRKQVFSMFSFLDNARRRMSMRVLLKNKNKISEISSNITSIDLFSDPIKELFSNYIVGQKKISARLEDLEEEIKNSRFSEEKCIKTKYMPYLAFDCAIYGVSLIFLSAFERDLGLEIHYYIALLNFVIIALSLYCFYYENNDFQASLKGESCTFKKKIWTFLKKCRPSLWSTFFLAILIITLGILFKRRFLFLTSIFWRNATYVVAVFLSIASLMLYLFICSRNNVREFRSCTREIKQICKPTDQDKQLLKAIRKINEDKEGLVKCLSKNSLSFEENNS